MRTASVSRHGQPLRQRFAAEARLGCGWQDSRSASGNDRYLLCQSGNPIDRPAPSEVLQHIIESSGIDPTELVNIFGSSEAVTQVLAGTKAIDPDRAQALADRLKLSPSIFLE